MASAEQVRRLIIHLRTSALPSGEDTVHWILNNTARMYKNKVSQEVVRLERRPQGAKFEELRDLVSGARGRVRFRSPAARNRSLNSSPLDVQVVYEIGNPDYGIWPAGTAMGLIKDSHTCEVLLKRTESEAEGTTERLNKLSSVKAKL